jgi:FkbM family methyltransferase
MIPKFLRKLSYSPNVRRVVRAAGLRPVAQKLYNRNALPADRILHLSYAGCQAKFLCPSVSEVRGLELFSSGPEKEFRRLFGFLQPGEVFFDIGAQYGVYGLLIANALASKVRVVAFEPFPSEYALLAANIELNNASNVQAVNAALSDRDGPVAMSNFDDKGACCPRIGAPVAGSRTIHAIRGDKLISTGNVPFPNVLKLDVEGHELAVLRGLSDALSDPRCHSLYCEIHDALLPGEDSNAVLLFIKSKGFNVISETPGFNHQVFAQKVIGTSA